MKLALALTLLTAPLAAQAQSNQKIVYNVVVTVVTGSATAITPTPVANPTPISTPILTPAPVPTPVATSTPPPNATPAPSSTGCVSFYNSAASSMNDVSTSLLQAQSLYSAAFKAGAISSSVYASGTETLATVRLDNADVRDIIRIAGPSDLIAQNIAFVSAEVGTLPGMLGANPQLSNSVATLATSMQTSLVQASKYVGGSTCPQAVP